MDMDERSTLPLKPAADITQDKDINGPNLLDKRHLNWNQQKDLDIVKINNQNVFNQKATSN